MPTADHERVEYAFLRPLLKHPAVYLDPAVSGRAFFDHIEVEINGFPVDTSGLVGPHGWLYSAFQKTFCSDELRREKYNKTFARVSNGLERSVANDLSDVMKESMELLEFDKYDVSKAKRLNFNFDG